MNSVSTLRAGIVASALAFAALPARAEVWTVDGSFAPGSDFTDIQSAVNAASDGDIIVVLEWDYQPFTIDAKGLTVVSQGNASNLGGIGVFGGTSQPAFVVRNVGADQDVIVRGFVSPYGAVVESCAGGVWIEDFHSDVFDRFGFCSMGGTHGAKVTNSARTTFSHCTLRGENAGDGMSGVMLSAHGLVVESSTVQLFDCDVIGGWGDDEGVPIPEEGGAGLRISSSVVSLSGCSVRGGAGGIEETPFGTVCGGTHGEGGPGVEFVGSGSTLRRTASSVAGGFADLDPLCPGETGPAGPDFAGTGQVLNLAGAAHRLAVNSPVDSGDTLTFTLGGVAGEAAAVLLSLGHSPVPFPAPGGVLLVDFASIFVLHVGGVPASGEATLSFPAPNLGLLEGLSLYAQAAFVDPSPATWLGGGAALVVLDLL